VNNEAEKIVAHRNDKQGRLEYQVKWKNRPDTQNSKVLADEVLDSSLFKSYWKDNKSRAKASKGGLLSKMMWLTCLFFLCWKPAEAQNFTAYDCSVVTHRKVVGVESAEACLQPVTDTLGKAETYKASIKKLNTEVTKFDIYNCHRFTATYKCKEVWYGAKRKKLSMTNEEVTKKQCKVMLDSILNSTREFRQVKHKIWQSRSQDKYDCHWLKTTSAKYVHKEVTAHRALVKGGDIYLKMHLSNMKCNYTTHFCVLEDGSMLIWDSKDHDFTQFKDLGEHTVHQALGYYLIPDLRTGGHTQLKSKDGRVVQLSSGILIYKKPGKAPEKFAKEALDYFKTFKGKAIIGNVGAHMTNLVRLIEAHLNLLYERACSNEDQVNKLKRFIIGTWPNQGAGMISRQPGITLTPKGDAFLIGRCKVLTIELENLNTDRKIGEICYKFIPIEIENKTRGYLRLPDHKLVKTSPKTPCEKDEVVFLRDNMNITYMVQFNTTLKRVNISSLDDEIQDNIHEVYGYAKDLVESPDDLLDQLSLLEIISQTAAPLEQLQRLHAIGGGQLETGIAAIFGSICEAAAEAGGYLIKALSGAVTHVVASLASGASKLVKTGAKGGATLISSAGEGLENVEEGLGALLSSFLPWLNLAIILAHLAYTVYDKKLRKLPNINLAMPVRQDSYPETKGEPVHL
jgi:hypothetical protein